jgi:hypothetical protein
MASTRQSNTLVHALQLIIIMFATRPSKTPNLSKHIRWRAHKPTVCPIMIANYSNGL